MRFMARLGAEAGAAAALGPGVGIVKNEGLLEHVFFVIDFGSVNKQVALGIDYHFHPVRLKHFVVGRRFVGDVKMIVEPAASAALNGDAKAGTLWHLILLKDQPYLVGGPFCKRHSHFSLLCYVLLLARFFVFQSVMAAFTASSASTEQCTFTGGSASSLAMSVFFNSSACSTFLPLSHSVASELAAIAEPHPKVLNLASTIVPSSATRI